MSNSINAPIRYFGGKGNFRKTIYSFFPKEDEYSTYIEPFGGSYTLGLFKPPKPIEIYNDLEKNVYSLFKVLSDDILFEKFKKKCDVLYYSEDIRNECKVLLKNDTISLEDRAFFFFVVNWMSVNGTGGFSTSSTVRRNMSKSVSDFLSSIDRLYDIHQRISRVAVHNCDGIELIKKSKYNNSRVLIYSDPPYDHSTRGSARYKVDMDREGQLKFLDAVIASKAKHIISGYNCEMYSVLEKSGFKRYDIKVNTVSVMGDPKSKIESLWINYKKKEK